MTAKRWAMLAGAIFVVWLIKDPHSATHFVHQALHGGATFIDGVFK